jgi:tryptophan synthase beta subunit
MNNPNMSHGYWFMQRCFASCIGYEVSNESQCDTDEQGRNVVAAVTGGGADSKKRRNGWKNEYLT